MESIKYFDHAATTALDEDVLKEMMPYLTSNYGNASSIYSIGRKAKEAVMLARMRVAASLNCKTNEIYFTSGGTESDNLALKGIAMANSKYGNHIITSKIEHPAILNSCKALENMGFRVTYLNVDRLGRVDLNELERSINRNTILISIMFANNEIGTIQPIRQIGNIARKYNIIFHTDSVQAVGNLNINVNDLKIDALSMSGHKFYGPKGVGALYVRENINFNRVMDGGHQEKDKRSGTENTAGIVGLGKAIENATKNLISYNENLKALSNFYITEVSKRITNIRINGDMDNKLSGNNNICFAGVDGSKLLYELDKRGICASSGSACSAGLINPSHVLLAIGVSSNLARGSLRVTFGKENTIEDVKYLVDSLEEVVNKIRH
ncbi:MAG: cysteine desulfurase [Clostridia bacterium]|nr:cysteine desulfurase [Clostridia bacterium]